MKNLKFLVIILSLGFVTACNQQKKSSQTEESDAIEASLVNTIPSEYVLFQEQNLTGVKNSDGEILVPAQYDSIHYEKGIIIAQKGELSYFFDGKKQIFENGTDVYSFEDKFLTCYDNETEYSMLYFPKTGVALEKILNCRCFDNAFMCEMQDHSYAFYTQEGDLKIDGLKKIIALRKLAKEGWTREELFLFSKDGSTNKFIYDGNGNLKYEISLQIWQTLAMTYLTRIESEYDEYPWIYGYRINLDTYIRDAIAGYTQDYYPEED